MNNITDSSAMFNLGMFLYKVHNSVQTTYETSLTLQGEVLRVVAKSRENHYKDNRFEDALSAVGSINKAPNKAIPLHDLGELKVMFDSAHSGGLEFISISDCSIVGYGAPEKDIAAILAEIITLESNRGDLEVRFKRPIKYLLNGYGRDNFDHDSLSHWLGLHLLDSAEFFLSKVQPVHIDDYDTPNYAPTINNGGLHLKTALGLLSNRLSVV